MSHLVEAARGPEALPDGIGVLVWRQGNKAKIVYAEMSTEHERLPGRTEPRTPKLKVPGAPQEGVVSIAQDPGSYGPCDKAWVVEVSKVTPQGGWGPMLYDVAMECASLWGGGLTSDRYSVSPFAHGVWSFYLKRRRLVRKRQLDNLDGELTPSKPGDDCAQTSADEWGFDDEVEWFETPESKRYVKKPATLKRLAKMGKLKVLGSAKLPGIAESRALPRGVLVERVLTDDPIGKVGAVEIHYWDGRDANRRPPDDQLEYYAENGAKLWRAAAKLMDKLPGGRAMMRKPRRLILLRRMDALPHHLGRPPVAGYVWHPGLKLPPGATRRGDVLVYFVTEKVMEDGWLLHELGHAYWEEVLPQDKRLAFIDAHYAVDKHSGAFDPKSFVSPYAWTNVEEDFAESVRVYVDPNAGSWERKPAAMAKLMAALG